MADCLLFLTHSHQFVFPPVAFCCDRRALLLHCSFHTWFQHACTLFYVVQALHFVLFICGCWHFIAFNFTILHHYQFSIRCASHQTVVYTILSMRWLLFTIAPSRAFYASVCAYFYSCIIYRVVWLLLLRHVGCILLFWAFYYCSAVVLLVCVRVVCLFCMAFTFSVRVTVFDQTYAGPTFPDSWHFVCYSKVLWILFVVAWWRYPNNVIIRCPRRLPTILTFPLLLVLLFGLRVAFIS